jgi:hypothetical protein
MLLNPSKKYIVYFCHPPWNVTILSKLDAIAGPALPDLLWIDFGSVWMQRFIVKLYPPFYLMLHFWDSDSHIALIIQVLCQISFLIGLSFWYHGYNYCWSFIRCELLFVLFSRESNCIHFKYCSSPTSVLFRKCIALALFWIYFAKKALFWISYVCICLR